MKIKKARVLVFVLCLFYPFAPIVAQLSKGSLMTSLDFGYNQTKSKFQDVNLVYDKKTKAGNALLQCGYFVRANLALGVSLGQYFESSAFTNTVNSTTGSSVSTISSAGVFSRGYKVIAKNKLALFAQADLAYNFGSSSQTSNTLNNGTRVNYPGFNTKTSGFTAALRPGITYFLTKNIALELIFGKIAYRYEKTNTSYTGINLGEEKNSGLNTDFTLSSLMLGINFCFGDQKEH